MNLDAAAIDGPERLGQLRRVGNSEDFHWADCKPAAKISDKNLQRFFSREEAVRVGNEIAKAW